MSAKLQIPQSFKRLHDAVTTHLNSFEDKHGADFTYNRVKEGFGIEYFDLRFTRRQRDYWDHDAPDLGFIRLRQLNSKLTELTIGDSDRLQGSPNQFLSFDVKLWDDDEREVTVPLKKRKAQAAAKFKRFKRIHEQIREAVVGGLKEDHLLLEEEKFTVSRPAKSDNAYVDKSRITRLRQITAPSFDLQRLIRLCEELNKCSATDAYCATAALVRAIIDHVPPIFGTQTFREVANNVGGKSTKASLLRLETSSRNIADSVLHQQIRKREVVPTRTQVNFSNDLDVLLGEIIRRLT